MARIITPGLDQYANGPHGNDWYKTTNIACPRCGAVFRLDEPDFEVNGPFVGTDLGQHYHWDKTDPFFAPLATTVLWPDGISGNCPWCDYYPIQVLFIDAGLSHPASVGDPIAGQLQDLVANHGVGMVTFRYAYGLSRLVGLFLLTDETPHYGADATQATQVAIIRTSATTINPLYTYTLATPSEPLTPTAARTFDPTLCATMDIAGITII